MFRIRIADVFADAITVALNQKLRFRDSGVFSLRFPIKSRLKFFCFTALLLCLENLVLDLIYCRFLCLFRTPFGLACRCRREETFCDNTLVKTHRFFAVNL